MLKMISVKMEPGIFHDADRFSKRAHVSQNAYINKAVRFMNRLHERKLMSERYKADAREARVSSEEVVKEFESFLDEGV